MKNKHRRVEDAPGNCICGRIHTLSPELRAKVKRAASNEGTAIRDWLDAAVAEEIGSVLSGQDLFWALKVYVAKNHIKQQDVIRTACETKLQKG